ncbi:hypothetical protein MHM88_14495 [Epibacterium sp. MM17-32]|uniref:hypothetical protein n=1 Tax=Epibacterium sp. MM17-32 TaxID=2917734 RepID=UPI001EF59293|nr:hypothetical protein [Epibacterium sp. MM17-32]MCG7629017.1 hypothetical protein [Epibacterium sp. MM17-32]
MPLRQLPKVFAKHRFSISKSQQPYLVFHLQRQEHVALTENIHSLADEGHVAIQYFPSWWVEIDQGWGLHCRCDDDKVNTLDLYDPRGLRHSTDFVSREMETYVREKEQSPSGLNLNTLARSLFLEASTALHLRLEGAPRISTYTGVTNEKAISVRVGDTMKFVPFSRLATAPVSQAPRREEGASGIRKREHVVRGHWRQYRSGVRVWVNAHRRGDPALGTTTRIVH